MAMKYTKVLAYMQEQGGRVEVDPMDPKLKEILGSYKAVGAMSAIRRFAKLDVRPVRVGRKAIAYELVSVQSLAAPVQPVPAIATPLEPEAAAVA